MKKFTLPLLAISCLALLSTAPNMQARDHDDRREYRDDRRDDRDGRRDGRGDRSRRYDGRGDHRYSRHDHGRDYSYRSRYPRRVIVYQSQSYGYNYYDLQTVLRREGYYRGPIDGVWGPGSRAALVRYQGHRGWRRDGQVDGRLIVNFGLGY